MSTNILITGAAGYIGGSIVADFLTSGSPLIKEPKIIAAVRSQEQADALSGLGVDVLQLDLRDEEAVTESILRYDVSIVINTADALKKDVALNLVTALGKVKAKTGKETYLIHTSGLSAFYEETGWPTDINSDSGRVFETEKKFADSFPIREVDTQMIEKAKAEKVTSFIVIPSLVYGRGTGKWNQLSVILPNFVRASIEEKKVQTLAPKADVPFQSGVHISDMTALYGKIVEKILQKEAIPNGEEGYYFALAHSLKMGTVAEHLAVALKARGITPDSTVGIWESDEAVAEAMGVPVQFVQILWNSGEKLSIQKPYDIGWQPKWDSERFYSHMDDEIQDVLDLGKAKSSLMDSLKG